MYASSPMVLPYPTVYMLACIACKVGKLLQVIRMSALKAQFLQGWHLADTEPRCYAGIGQATKLVTAGHLAVTRYLAV